VDVELLPQHLQGERVHRPRRLSARAVHLEASFAQPPEEVLDEHAARRVAGAEEQDPVGSGPIGHASSGWAGWGTTTSGAASGNAGTSQRNSAVASAAPTSCATTKPGTSWGRIPAKVSVAARARVTAGFAKLVEDVNQYAAAMYAPTANGTALERRRAHPQITDRRPKVATSSPRSCGAPARAWVDAEKIGSSNIASANATPAYAPAIWAATYTGTSPQRSPPWEASARVTAGLKCAPEIGPKARMRAVSPAPVA